MGAIVVIYSNIERYPFIHHVQLALNDVVITNKIWYLIVLGISLPMNKYKNAC